MNVPAKAAVLIDSDNVKADFAEKVISESGAYGELIIRKAYGNWHGDRLKPWVPNLKGLGIQAVQQFDFVKGKNATDMAMTVDAMDILFREDVDVFCLISSDYDFTPLAIRIRAAGKRVIAWGRSDSSEAYQNACSKFIFLDSGETTKSGNSKIESNNDLLSDKELIQALLDAFDGYELEWMKWKEFTDKVHKHSSLYPSKYGYDKWIEVVNQIDLFEVDVRNGIQMIRLNPTSLN